MLYRLSVGDFVLHAARLDCGVKGSSLANIFCGGSGHVSKGVAFKSLLLTKSIDIVSLCHDPRRWLYISFRHDWKW